MTPRTAAEALHRLDAAYTSRTYITPRAELMIRTQVYLTATEQQGLRTLAQSTGQTQSELIREAVDQLVARVEGADRHSLLRQARGMWEQRQDLPDFATLRRELDRSTQESGECRDCCWIRTS